MGLNSLMIVIVNHNVSFSIILRMYLLTLMRFDRIKLTMSKQPFAFTTKEPYLAEQTDTSSPWGQLIMFFFSFRIYLNLQELLLSQDKRGPLWYLPF